MDYPKVIIGFALGFGLVFGIATLAEVKIDTTALSFLGIFVGGFFGFLSQNNFVKVVILSVVIFVLSIISLKFDDIVGSVGGSSSSSSSSKSGGLSSTSSLDIFEKTILVEDSGDKKDSAKSENGNGEFVSQEDKKENKAKKLNDTKKMDDEELEKEFSFDALEEELEKEFEENLIEQEKQENKAKQEFEALESSFDNEFNEELN